jgi:hypothetical protein
MKKVLFILFIVISISTNAQVQLVSGGSANAYTLTFPGVLSYTNGVSITFKASFANTGTATININSLGAKTIMKQVSNNLASGDILSGQVVNLVYDGTNFQMISASGAVAGSGSGWSLTGNSGTVDGTNFIGNIDNIPLTFKVNNQKAGFLSVQNTSFGFSSLTTNGGQDNVAIGSTALNVNLASGNTAVGSFTLSQNTFGAYNVAIGHISLYNNTFGGANTAVGWRALNSNIAGSNATAIGTNAMQYANSQLTAFTNTNVAVGYEALRGSTTASANTGNSNTATGYNSMRVNTTGSNNTANGYQTLLANTTGLGNTAIGTRALTSNTDGTNNTAIGYETMVSNTTGFRNIAIGYQALFGGSSCSQIVAIGNSAGLSNSTLTNATAIGSNTIATASDQVRIGSTIITSIGGQVGWTTLSDARFKKNVKEDVHGLDFIMQLKPVTYTLDAIGISKYLGIDKRMEEQAKDSKNSDVINNQNEAIQAKEKIVYSGFLAQDVEVAAKKVGYDFSGVDAPKNENDYYGLRYAEFVVPMVKAMQEMNAKIDALQKENEELKKLIGK